MTKLMLIEDDITMRDLLKTLLELEGFEVAINDKDVPILQYIRQEKPDLILLDVHLRGKTTRDNNGFDILKRIREDPELKDVKVVMSSGIDVSDKCKMAGADGFILKPYMPDDLIKQLRDQQLV